MKADEVMAKFDGLVNQLKTAAGKTAEKVSHTPGDVNHKFLGAAGYDFCTTCGESLRGKRTLLETEMLEALENIANELESVWRGLSTRPNTYVVIAREVIRKAKGEL